MRSGLLLALLFVASAPVAAGVNEEYQAARRLFEAGDYLKAMDAFRGVLARHPTAPAAATSLYQIGLSAERAERPDEARRAYQTFLERHPHHDLVAFARQRLKELGEGPVAAVPASRTAAPSDEAAMRNLEGRLLGPSGVSATPASAPAAAPATRPAPSPAPAPAGAAPREPRTPANARAGRLERSRSGELGYILGANETLAEAAHRIWGDTARAADLARWNDLEPGASVAPGKRLRISPPRAPAAFPDPASGASAGASAAPAVSSGGTLWPSEDARPAHVPSLPPIPHASPSRPMAPRLPSLATGAAPTLRRTVTPPSAGEIVSLAPVPRPSAPDHPAAEHPAPGPAERPISGGPLLPVSLGEIPLPNVTASVAAPAPIAPATSYAPPSASGHRPAGGLLAEPRLQPRSAWTRDPAAGAGTMSLSILEPTPSFRLLSDPTPASSPQGVIVSPARESVATGVEAARARLGIASSLRRAGQFDEAEAELRAAIVAAPDMPVAYNNLADLLLERGRTAEAKGLAERALSLAPPDPGPYLDTLGWSLHLLGMESEALSRLNQAVETEATSTRLYHRAEVFRALGQIPRARRDLEEALTYNPDPILAGKIRESMGALAAPAPDAPAPTASSPAATDSSLSLPAPMVR